MKYDYATVNVYANGPNNFNIVTPHWEAKTEASLEEVLQAVPNMIQEEEKGGWETYSTIFIGSTVVFLVRKPRILIPTGVFGIQ